MPPDHIAPEDYETRVSLARLNTASSEITQQDRDRVLAFVAGNLWTLPKLDERIIAVHNSQCASCPLRAAAEVKTKPDRIDQIIKIVKLLVFIIAALVLILAAVHGVEIPAALAP